MKGRLVFINVSIEILKSSTCRHDVYGYLWCHPLHVCATRPCTRTRRAKSQTNILAVCTTNNYIPDCLKKVWEMRELLYQAGCLVPRCERWEERWGKKDEQLVLVMLVLYTPVIFLLASYSLQFMFFILWPLPRNHSSPLLHSTRLPPSQHCLPFTSSYFYLFPPPPSTSLPWIIALPFSCPLCK